ncbi:MAG: hypothetical protein ACK56I_29525, partial [bacterium]
QVRPSLGRTRFGKRQIGLDEVGGETRQHLPLFHDVAHGHRQFGQPEPTDLGADRRLLPRGDAAVGGEPLGPVGPRRLGHADHQRRTRRSRCPALLRHRRGRRQGGGKPGCGKPARDERARRNARITIP